VKIGKGYIEFRPLDRRVSVRDNSLFEEAVPPDDRAPSEYYHWKDLRKLQSWIATHRIPAYACFRATNPDAVSIPEYIHNWFTRLQITALIVIALDHSLSILQLEKTPGKADDPVLFDLEAVWAFDRHGPPRCCLLVPPFLALKCRTILLISPTIFGHAVPSADIATHRYPSR